MYRRPTTFVALALGSFVLLYASATGGGAKAPDRTSVISYWSDDPLPSIWTVRPNGTGRARILHTRQNAKRPRISPDGRWVAFDARVPRPDA